MRQEVDCLWETAEVQEALAALTGTANPDMANRLTVKEYNAYITCQVANNLDAQAWARVDRKKRPAELAAELAAQLASDSGVKTDACPDEGRDEKAKSSDLREIQMPFSKPSDILDAMLSYVRTTEFTSGLDAIYNTQTMQDNLPEEKLPAESKKHWQQKRVRLTALLQTTRRLEELSSDPSQMKRLKSMQAEAFKERSAAMHDEPDEAEAELQPEVDVGIVNEKEEAPPVVWVEPPPGVMMPSEYTKLYLQATIAAKQNAGSAASKIKLPNLQQQRWLALCVGQLDVILSEEQRQVPWKDRTCKVYRLFSEGGCGKTWLIHSFVVPAVLYAFQTVDAIRLVAFTNAQAANLSSEHITARTLHTACGMTVQKLSNELLAPGQKLKPLMAYWEPVRVLAMDEITLCPAEAYNMGMLRTAFGRQEMTQMNIGDYAIRGNYWGKIQLVLQLGDPLQNRPVRSISLFDTQEMLVEMAREGKEVSVEAQNGIRAFGDADLTMQLDQTRRFVPDDPLPLFLQSLRRADASRDQLVDPALWALYAQRCAAQDQKGTLQRDQRLLEPRMQDAYSLHLYWSGVVRAWFARAQRDARRLRTPLYWIRAPYEITGLDSLKPEQKLQVQKQLMRSYNIHYTAHLHPMMMLHAGQRLKLTEKVSAEDRLAGEIIIGQYNAIIKEFFVPEVCGQYLGALTIIICPGLVQEATGTVLKLVLDPAEPPVQPDEHGNIILKYMPLGVWMHMDACVTAPLAKELRHFIAQVPNNIGLKNNNV